MLNEIKLIGMLGKDPEVKNKENGDIIVNFSLATSEKWKDKNSGEMQSKTQWHRIVVFQQGVAKVARDYLKKGSKVYICGMMEYREYEKDGIKRQICEVVVKGYEHKLLFLSPKDGQVENHAAKNSNISPVNEVNDVEEDELPW